MLTESTIDVAMKIAGSLFKNSERLSYGSGVTKFMETLASLKADKAGVTNEDRAKWLRENWNTQEFAAAVKYTINTDVLAQMYALAFFQLVSLADNEWPVLETFNRDGKFRVKTIGEANGAPGRQFVDRRSHLQHLLERYASELVEYQLMDLQIGNISSLDRVLNELTYEFNLGIDKIARTLLNANVVTSGLRAKLNLHKEIVAANIPDSNYLNLNTLESGKEGKITVEKMKRVLDYFVRFASDVELDGAPLMLQSMYISTVNQRDFWDFCDLVAGYAIGGGAVVDPQNTVPQGTRVDIWKSGKLESMFGQTFSTITRNTIAAGDSLCASNKPCGMYFEKPGMSETIQDTTLEARQKNKGKIGMAKVHVFVTPDPWMYRLLKVKF